MHEIEPYYNWIRYYSAEKDPHSPFYGREHSEFEFSDAIYNYLIHPQWEHFGSPTLYLKVLYADYEEGFAIIELIGEWNDAINNDVMWLKREVIEPMLDLHIQKFILLGENVLNFHSSDDCYYEEWFDDVSEGWIAAVNFREHIRTDWQEARIDQYLIFGGVLDELPWRPMSPQQLFQSVSSVIIKRLY
jgi:hypothetical protein